MSILTKIFGKSPFEPLYQHMLKVNECVNLVKPPMEALRHRRHRPGRYQEVFSRLDHLAAGPALLVT